MDTGGGGRGCWSEEGPHLLLPLEMRTEATGGKTQATCRRCDRGDADPSSPGSFQPGGHICRHFDADPRSFLLHSDLQDLYVLLPGCPSRAWWTLGRAFRRGLGHGAQNESTDELIAQCGVGRWNLEKEVATGGGLEGSVSLLFPCSPFLLS